MRKPLGGAAFKFTLPVNSGSDETMQRSEIVHVIDDDEERAGRACALLEAKGYAAHPHATCEEFLNRFSFDAALCIVADLRMPGMGGLDLQAHLLAKAVNLPLL
jgi:FixJ family two-component response regulator